MKRKLHKNLWHGHPHPRKVMVSEKGSSNSGGQGHTQIATVFNVIIYMTLYSDDLVFLLPVY